MAETLVERVWAWLHETFPERQIYIRSDGRVQFFTFGPTLQATCAGLFLIFLGWVAFATVNVVFKDRIIAAKDHRYQQMQSAYENRVADLQISYDEVNGALVSAEDKFKQTADELQTKQNTIISFLNRKEQVNATLTSLANTGVTAGSGADAAKIGPAPAGGNTAATDNLGAITSSGPSDGDEGGSSVLPVMPQAVPPQPRTAKPTRASFLDFDNAVGRLAGALFGPHEPKTPTMDFAKHPVLRALAAQTERVKRIGMSETLLMTKTQSEVAQGVDNIQTVLRRTGINADQFAQKFANAEGIGGPDIPLQSVHIEGISDVAFQNAYLTASAILDQMNNLLAAMRHVPLTTPVSGPQFERTSGFGPRVDPFTGRYAFHPGLDFAGPWGSTVVSTAPGVVVWAGPRGAYGNMVEIDHGMGIHTRYGHLSSILVQVGARVGKGAAVGKLGSTGRSTGPHVHYEVWYEDVVRNPSQFIEAGRHVLQ